LFLRQLSSLKYLARQGLGIRKIDDFEGNLIQLLKLRAEDVPAFNEWIEKGNYLSHDIINELIEMMGQTVLRSILDDVRTSKFFGLIADESKDVSNKEQLTCVIRWVSPNLTVKEDFLGMYELGKTDAASITAALKDIILRCNLQMSKCRWQAYDGAATMAGTLNGVSARIRSEYPAALYLHCANHNLDLALQSCSRESSLVRDALDYAQNLATFIKMSPKRMGKYLEISAEYENSQTLHQLCPTRWTIRTRSLSSVLNSYQAIHETLMSISEENNQREICDKARGLARKMENFDLYFGLFIGKNIFSVCEQVATTLQTETLTAGTVMTCLRALSNNLQLQRDGFVSIFQEAQDSAAKSKITVDPCLPRPRKIPRKLQHGNAQQHVIGSISEHFKLQFYEAIDAIISELQHRFDSESYYLLAEIEKTILQAANEKIINISDRIKDLYSADLKMTGLEVELRILPGIIKELKPDINQITSIDTVSSVFSLKPEVEVLLPNLKTLISIYMAAPMSVASGERTFSAQRRIKTYLRSNMNEKRYNNLASSEPAQRQN